MATKRWDDLPIDELALDFLIDQHGGREEGEHPQYTVWDWTQDVAKRSTRLGYWDWVGTSIEAEEAWRHDGV